MEKVELLIYVLVILINISDDQTNRLYRLWIVMKNIEKIADSNYIPPDDNINWQKWISLLSEGLLKYVLFY